MPDDLEERLHQLVRAVHAQKLLAERYASAAIDRLQAIIEHVAETVPFYSDLPGSELSSLPLITREQIASDPSAFRSRVFDTDDLVERSTSGTTGVPLKVARDPASSYLFIYETYKDVFQRAPELAGTTAPGKCAVLLVNDNPQRTEQVFINPSLDFSLVWRVILGRSAEMDQYALEVAIREQPPLLYGRPRSLLRLAEMVEESGRRRRRPKPKAILCSGDNLYASDRKVMEEVFQAPVYNAYASQEGGVIALECSHHKGFHVLDHRAVVEIIAEQGTGPQAAGSGELVVTNLENWAMPFLRYRSGDMATVEAATCGCAGSGAFISKLDGRDSTYFVVAGRRFNPSILNPILEELPIRQFQVVQEAPSAFRVNWIPTPGSIDARQVERNITRTIRAELGTVEVCITAVESIGQAGQKVQRYVRAFGMSREA
jgi:phenylacetate-CoA ligase